MSEDSPKFKQVMEELAKRRNESGVDINGKRYSMVKDRVEVFRREFGSSYGIDTRIEYPYGFELGAVVIASAKITDRNGIILASGHAMDRIGSDEISWTAAVEATETAAIGRALACFGLHGGEYASDAEMSAIPREQVARQEKDSRVLEQQPGRYPTQGQRGVQFQPDPIQGQNFMTNYFIPDEHEAVWNNPSEMARKVIDEINRIMDPNDLSKYWGDLEEFMIYLGNESKGLLAEIKATFQTRYNEMR